MSGLNIVKENNKMKNAAKNEQNIVKDAKEKCVVCGVETKYMFSTPISERQDYVEGAGQFCKKCYYDLYIKGDRK